MRRSIVVAVAWSALALGSVMAAAACSGDSQEAAPSRPPVSPSPGTDSSVSGDGGPGGDAAPDATCTGEAGCFSCEPVQELDFLNECTDGLCTPFDNATRLPLFKAGQPLPAIP